MQINYQNFKPMKVYLFRSKTNRLIGGFTQDKTGSNLPSKFGAWIFKKELEIDLTSNLIGADPKKIIADIEKQGFSVQKAKIETKENF